MTRIGLVQMTSGLDMAANADVLTGRIRALAGEGAELVFTPEMSGLLDRDRKRLFAAACTEADDPVLRAVRAAAKETATWVALGSLALKDARTPHKLVNRSLLIDSGGEIAARYDKIHLFDVELGEGERYAESKSFLAGSRAVIADTPAGRLGLSVCYDIRFPRLYDALSEAGAEILAVPAAFTRPTGAAHWHVLCRARAIENAAFLVAAAQTGEHEDGRATYGHSLAVDPWGEILLDMGDAPGGAVCDLDRERLRGVRRRLPVMDHRTHIGRL